MVDRGHGFEDDVAIAGRIVRLQQNKRWERSQVFQIVEKDRSQWYFFQNIYYPLCIMCSLWLHYVSCGMYHRCKSRSLIQKQTYVQGKKNKINTPYTIRKYEAANVIRHSRIFKKGKSAGLESNHRKAV